jgi:hypothetical protein
MNTACTIFGLILLVAGVLCFAWPTAMWRLEHFTSVERGEPTDWALTWIRAKGGVAAIVGAGLLVVSILFPDVAQRMFH